MKKKIGLFLAVMAFIALFSGCGAADKPADSTPPVSTPTDSAQITQNTETPDIGYRIVKQVLKNQDTNALIYYPQMTEFKGELLMDYMNQSLKSVSDIYSGVDTYKDVKIDYTITRMEAGLLSVLFKGTATVSGKPVNIQHSVNLDIKTSNPVDFSNFIKVDQVSALRDLLKQKAKDLGQPTEFESVRLYFAGENVVFYYMPADDSATDFVEISIPLTELDAYTIKTFGDKPAS